MICLDKLFSTFYNKYNKIVNKHAPFKRMPNRKAKQLSKPWITTGIKASIAVKSMHQVMTLGTNTIETKSVA